MPSTTTFRRGQVIVVNVPFSDRSGTKPRPALVISSEAYHAKLPDLIVCPISSQPRFYRRPSPGDCPLRDWRAIGLRQPSTVRISKILAVDKAIIKRPLGLLSPQDLARVEAAVRQALGLA